MIAVFCFSEIKGFPADGVYLFDSEHDAQMWCVSVLKEAGIAVEVDGGWRLTDEPPEAPVIRTARSLISGAQEGFGLLTWLHIEPVYDNRLVFVTRG